MTPLDRFNQDLLDPQALLVPADPAVLLVAQPVLVDRVVLVVLVAQVDPRDLPGVPEAVAERVASGLREPQGLVVQLDPRVARAE